MKIQARLNIIAGSIILTLFITLAVVYIVQQPIEHMDDELDIMNELESSLLNFQATLNAFNTVSFRGHMSLWEVDRRLLEESFDKLNDITYLVNINDDVAEAV
ncbi:MAG: hypothetical protein PF447_14255, partial [Spirochaetaceae bacterium]|nr:hypothetical protein [Spirochaetaceae bacterium]